MMVTKPKRSYFRRVEARLQQAGFQRIVGFDEAGRGPWAGPLSVAGVVYNSKLLKLRGLADSKLLKPAKRDELVSWIRENCEYFQVFISVNKLDKIGLGAALRLAFQTVHEHLQPDYCLLDGKSQFGLPTPCETIVKGDRHIRSIAAAGNIAKVVRDRFMEEQAIDYPEYGFDSHYGYGTKRHQHSLAKYGPCPLHRRSFAPISEYYLQARD